MKIKYFKNLNFKYKVKIEFLFLSFLLFISFLSLNFYNKQKAINSEKWLNVLNNTYLKKTIEHGLSSQKPRFLEVNYKVETGESLKKILLKYSIPESEINNLINSLSKKTNLKNLKVNTEIKFLFDNKENEIVKFEFPITKVKEFTF